MEALLGYTGIFEVLQTNVHPDIIHVVYPLLQRMEAAGIVVYANGVFSGASDLPQERKARLSWALQQPAVAAVIFSTSSSRHLHENIDGLRKTSPST